MRAKNIEKLDRNCTSTITYENLCGIPLLEQFVLCLAKAKQKMQLFYDIDW